MKNLIRFTSLCGAVVLFPVGNTIAQTSGQCAIAPTCAELGYEQKAADCNGQYMLKCPFDQTKVFCGGIACSIDYSMPSCNSSVGSCEKCGDKYKYISCNSGWTLSSGNCVANVCSASDYPYTSAPDVSIGTVISCKPGAAAIRYAYSKCNYGWHVSAGKCVTNDCSGYGSVQNCASYNTCQSGNYEYFRCTSCPEGCYELVDGECYHYKSSLSELSDYESYKTCISNGITYYRATSCYGNMNRVCEDGKCATFC